MGFNLFGKGKETKEAISQSSSLETQNQEGITEKNVQGHYNAKFGEVTEGKKEGKETNSFSLAKETFNTNSEALDAHLEKSEALLKESSKILVATRQEVTEILEEFKTQILAKNKENKNAGREDFNEIRNDMSKKLKEVDTKVGKISMMLSPYRGNGPYKSSYSEEPFIIDEIYLKDKKSNGRAWELNEVISSGIRHFGLSDTQVMRTQQIANQYMTLNKEFSDFHNDFFLFSQGKWNFGKYKNDDVKAIAQLEYSVS